MTSSIPEHTISSRDWKSALMPAVSGSQAIDYNPPSLLLDCRKWRMLKWRPKSVHQESASLMAPTIQPPAGKT